AGAGGRTGDPVRVSHARHGHGRRRPAGAQRRSDRAGHRRRNHQHSPLRCLSASGPRDPARRPRPAACRNAAAAAPERHHRRPGDEGDDSAQSHSRHIAQHAGAVAGSGRGRDRGRIPQDAAERRKAGAALSRCRNHAAAGPAPEGHRCRGTRPARGR
ncbi:hypothetical protein OY671_010430, partial [Metschnikowia pulcherrima]